MKALSFKEQIAADNAAVFLNDMEFAELHDLNGTECKAIVQDISVAQSLSIQSGKDDYYPGVYGSQLQLRRHAAGLLLSGGQLLLQGRDHRPGRGAVFAGLCDGERGQALHQPAVAGAAADPA